MSRVLLIFDDFTELTTMESNLKRIGFDVIGISNEFSLSQQLLAFNPDIIIASGVSTRVNSLSVGKKLKDIPRWTGKTLLIFHNSNRPKPEDLLKIRIDGALEYPVSFTQLINTVSEMLQVSAETLLERWNKVRANDDGGEANYVNKTPEQLDDSIFVTGGEEAADLAKEISDLERKEIEKQIGAKNWKKEIEEYEKHRKERKLSLQEMAQQGGFDIKRAHDKKETKRRLKKLREDWNREDLEKQDKLRQQFTRALFKKSR